MQIPRAHTMARNMETIIRNQSRMSRDMPRSSRLTLDDPAMVPVIDPM